MAKRNRSRPRGFKGSGTLEVRRLPRPGNCPTNETLREVATKHGLPDSTEVVEELSDIWQIWRLELLRDPDPAARDRRRTLTTIAGLAKDLAEEIQRMGPHGRAEMFDWMPGSADVSQFTDDLWDLYIAASVTAGKLKPSKKGRQGNPPLRRVYWALLRLWRRHLGDDAPVQSKRDAETYEGPFFAFVGDFLVFLGNRQTPLARGKMIERAIRDYRKWQQILANPEIQTE